MSEFRMVVRIMSGGMFVVLFLLLAVKVVLIPPDHVYPAGAEPRAFAIACLVCLALFVLSFLSIGVTT